MAILNVENSFLTENRSVYTFFNQPGQGLYIPLYQREYSWDNDNIEQLLEDLRRGIQRIASGEIANNDSKEVRFLGTIITVIEPNRQNIYPVDLQAVPSKIEKLIDGQQRVSTIALMATLLAKHLIQIKGKIKPGNQIYDQINEICDIWIDHKLATIFSFDLGRGTPRLKPKIVRGAKDYWTREHSVDTAYQSELSNYLGHFIKAYTENSMLPSLSKDKFGNSLFYQNGRKIESWLKEEVSIAHEDNNDEQFATAHNILKYLSQDLIWEFERPDLVEIINQRDFSGKKTNSYVLCELVQTLSVCHYLLDRCCFTIIQPTDDDWAFDMFQSLNATGTPLTAIETFKPTVVNTLDKESEQKFKGSISETYFTKVEELLSNATSAHQKNTRTNDFLTSFFITLDGRTISNHFSYQRKALDSTYANLIDLSKKEAFIKRLGNYAEFYQKWLDYDGKNNQPFPEISTSDDADIASALLLFLKSSNHKMAITILASFYNEVIEEGDNAVTNFIESVKAVTSYYFLWRATNPNAGLDSSYRDFFKEVLTGDSQISINSIKSYFVKKLKAKGVNSREEWINAARNYLKYDTTSKDVIRFALLVAANNTIPDPLNKGLIKDGRAKTAEYLCINKWLSGDLKSIEHIAPQSNKDNYWNSDLYDPQAKTFQAIGNLTLLPQDINSSVGKKGWREKLLYYKSLAEKDPDNIKKLDDTAKVLEISLNPTTLSLLQNSQYNQHIESISQLTEDDCWNKEFVDKRTYNLLEIIWDQIYIWLK